MNRKSDRTIDGFASHLHRAERDADRNRGPVARFSFMHPLAPEAADTFCAIRSPPGNVVKRIVFGAFDGESLVGTVTLLLDCTEQPHPPRLQK